MPLTRIPEKTILTTLYCPRCENVGRLYRKPRSEAPDALEGNSDAEYFYTFRCLQCGEMELWAVPQEAHSPA